MSQRLTRKEIKRDEFMETLGGVAQFVREHSRGLVWGVLVVVAGALLTVLFMGYLEQRERRASEVLARALDVRQAAIDPDAPNPEHPTAPSFPDVAARRDRERELLQTLREEYGRSDAAQIAAVFLGQMAAEAGDNDGARALWQEFLDAAPDHMLAAEIRVNLMVLDRADGRGEELVHRLRTMLDGNSPRLPRDVLWYQLALTLEELGRLDEAAEAFQMIADEFPQSAYASDARIRTGGRDSQRVSG